MKSVSESTRNFIQLHRNDDPRTLALKYGSKRTNDPDLQYALTQISGRQVIREKIPSWYETDGLIYPVHLSLEQCSSESTALYKSSLLSGNTFADLTGGFGVDCAFISKKFQSGIYIERQKELYEIVRQNYQTLKIENITVENRDSGNDLSLIPKVDCIFLDPSRRTDSGKKIISIADCDPDIGILKNSLLKKSNTVMVKLSPMLDISSALQILPETTQVHVVSVNNECKELLFILQKDPVTEPEIFCVNLSKQQQMHTPFSFRKSKEKEGIVECTSDISGFLYEPNASILKAGAYKSVAIDYNIKKLHADSHLYTASQQIKDFPGRIFRVKSVFFFNKQDIKRLSAITRQANLSIRNFPSSVEQLRKKLNLEDGGDDYIFGTTLSNGKHVLILCQKP